MEISQFGKEFDKKLRNTKRIKNFINSFEVVGKIIPVLIFLSTLYGSFQLLNFSSKYHVSLLDLAKPSIIFTYGVLFFILTSIIILLPFSFLIWNYSFGSTIHKVFIRRARVGFLRRNKIFSLMILCFVVSLWPLAFVIENTRWWPVFFYCTPIYLGLYVIFFTGKLNFTQWSFYRALGKKLTAAFVLYFPVLLGMACFIFFAQIFQRYLHNIPATPVLLIISLSFFLLSFFAIKSSVNKKIIAIVKEIFFVVVFSVFVLFSFPSNSLILGKTANVAGLGFETRCYQADEIKKAGIPDEYVKNSSNGKIEKIFVVANIDDIYYLSINDQSEPKATLRFKNSNLMQQSCPE